MIVLFWSAVVFLAYTFLGYPLALWILSRFRYRVHHKASIWPEISIIIPAHNEAGRIGQKILNTLELTYPFDRREILVASDGSSDDTVAIVREYADRGVKLIEIPQNRGKHFAQMVARDESHGEILVFTDVSAMLEPTSLQKIVSNFSDPQVGCVTGEDHIVMIGGKGTGEATYVHYDKWIRRLESRIGSLVGLSGSFFAARRMVCEPWNPVQSSDFFLALQAVSKGFRAIVDPECGVRYNSQYRQSVEFKRKVRTVVHGLDVLFSHAELLNPFRFGPFSWQLISHKLLRWLVPFAVLLMTVSCLCLWDAGFFYRFVFVCLLLMYASGLALLSSRHADKIKLVKLAGFFVLGNTATIVAWIKFCSGEKYTAWQPTPRS
jgi:glycosyltransferase involved in cell wall biosynthesis